jgi:carboxylesterase
MASGRSIPRIDPLAARPFEYWRGEEGVLLLHGFAGTPPEVHQLGLFLAQSGYSTIGPLLAGHGTTPSDMRQTRWRDWLDSAESALDRLRGHASRLFVGGQSMGALLALQLAARHPEIRGAIAFAAPLRLRDWRIPLIPLLHRVFPYYQDRGESDLGDPTRVSRLHSYGQRPTVCIYSLHQLGRAVARMLPQVRCAALVMHGRHDRVAAPADSQYLYDHLGSTDKRLVWMERSGHAITVDWEDDLVEATVLQWLSERS